MWVRKIWYPRLALILFCLAGFLVVRICGRLAAVDLVPSIYVRGIHIHHFVYGIFLMAIGGCISFIPRGTKMRLLATGLFGFGLGVTFEELILWCRLQDFTTTWTEPWGIIVALSIIVLVSLLDRT